MPDLLPTGWDEERVRQILDHYESQAEEEAVAEDEAAYETPSQTVMAVPNELVPAIEKLIAATPISRPQVSLPAYRRTHLKL